MSSRNQLIVFTRFPVPGEVKTRLIPELGPEGAADLHRDMTAYAMRTANSLHHDHGIDVEVHHIGASLQDMKRWLGEDVVYERQGAGDLGRKLNQAFSHGFSAGYKHVVIIGTDCPDLTVIHLREAFTNLLTHDLVLGPATDGGYYLVGLGKATPHLFRGITWGTSSVLGQTVKAARSETLSVFLLPTLSDVDRPEDLGVWNAVKERPCLRDAD